jgi:ATP-dependent helicase HrpB
MLQPLLHLPAAQLIEPVNTAIGENNLIIGAPPGAGKSTVLPLSLLSAIPQGKVLLMQPRRVVVRNLANYLAGILNENVGDTVGYRIKGESKVGKNTRLELITEGILARMIQSDPELTGVSAIVFDEFHERSIHSDFGLALALDVQGGLREDLRLVVMSATLDVEPLTALIDKHGAVPVINLNAEGRTFPVNMHYSKDVLAHDVVSATAEMTTRVFSQHQGDVLVFLPGSGAIRGVAQRLSALVDKYDVALHSLFGAMGKDAQQAAINPDPQGRRKIILATNIAETSLTIEGVKVVVDSMWENQAQYNPSSGFTQLMQQRISRASAIQRAGRAGRVSEGDCYRLCSQSSFERMAQHNAPQVLREDVSSLLLDALQWGATPSSLAMLTQPSTAQLKVASHNLTAINALRTLDDSQIITPYGRTLSNIPCHPNLANLLVRCEQGVQGVAPAMQRKLKCAAPIVVALAENLGGQFTQTYVIDALLNLDGQTRKQLHQQASKYAKYVGVNQNDLDINGIDEDALALCIAIAFPQRVAFYRGLASDKVSEGLNGKQKGQGATQGKFKQSGYKLASGKGGELEQHSSPQWLAVLHGQQTGNTVKFRLAQPIDEALLRAVFPDEFTNKKQVRFNVVKKAMEARVITGFHAIDLASEPVSGQEKQQGNSFWKKQTAHAWFEYLENIPVSEWPLTSDDWQWWNRLKLAASFNLPQAQAFDKPDPWPQSLPALMHSAKEALIEPLSRCESLTKLQKLPWKNTLNNALSWPQQDALASLLPTHLPIPTGRDAALDYRDNGDVVLAVRMQEMYSQTAPLTVAGGKVNIVYELLSPAGRPLQTTKDLAGFWTGSYLAIQKEMKGRYPKHFWPDEPATATPTARTKKAMG